jgi:alpha-mannosidase
MFLLDKRINVIAKELKDLCIKQSFPILQWQYKEGRYFRPDEADQSSVSYENFDTKTMYWHGMDRHYWFKTTFEVPEALDGKQMWFRAGSLDGWDARNPQFVFFLNGKPIQGMDTNHREVLITESAKAGEAYRFDLQAWAGNVADDLHLTTSVYELDPKIAKLYYDIQVPLEAFSRMDKESRAYLSLLKALDDTINLLDLRTPYSDAFYASLDQALDFIEKTIYEDLAGHDEVIASCIGHTHIDVAWWWTVEQTREKVVRSFSTVLKLMDEYPDYHFMSSQAVLYAFLKERYPDLYSQVKERIAEKRWEPEGGMWVEADCNVTSGESLVRQFLHGKRFFRDEFGVDNVILWLPDVFGYSGALPQIMKKSGIDYFMTTKLAWNQLNKIPHDTFNWRGIDGSEVFTHMITTLGVGQPVENFFTTYNGELHPDAIMGGWERYQEKAINNDILISYGFGDGGGGPTRKMLETSARMDKGVMGIPKVRQVFARQYFDELHDRVKDDPRLDTWEGELYFEYHRGTLTSMARNKRSNRKSELGLMDTEFLSVLTHENTNEKLDPLWKTVLVNQFHDILPGTSIHEVYEVTKQEYQEVKETLETIQDERLDDLTDTLNTDNKEAGSGLMVLNTTGFERSDIVDLGEVKAKALVDSQGKLWPVQDTAQGGAIAYVDNLPAKGYETFALSEETVESESAFSFSDDFNLETPFYSVRFNEKGELASVYDKENDREILQEGQAGNVFRMYEDKPLDYDNWDIENYYVEKFWDWDSYDVFEWTEKGPVRATLHIEKSLSKSTLSQDIHFYKDKRRIDFVTKVDWKEAQHLLKVHFPVDIHTDEATFDIQFGNLKRKTHTNTSWDVARFESCGQKWVDLSEGHYGVSLLNDCKYGHSVHDSNIGLTLIKSGIVPNPVTDQEMHYFSYSLYPHAGDWRQGQTVKESYFFNQETFSRPVALDQQKNLESFSLASVNKANVVIETIKYAVDDEDIIVRLYESDNAKTKTSLNWGERVSRVVECNLMEEDLEDQADFKLRDEGEGSAFDFEIKPYEIKTYRLTLA